MDEAEHDVLAYITFPAQHRTKLHSTNPLSASTRRSSAGPMSSASSPEDSLVRLVGAVLLEQNDDWQTSEPLQADRSNGRVGKPSHRGSPTTNYTQGRLTNDPLGPPAQLHHLNGHDHHRSSDSAESRNDATSDGKATRGLDGILHAPCWAQLSPRTKFDRAAAILYSSQARSYRKRH